MEMRNVKDFQEPFNVSVQRVARVYAESLLDVAEKSGQTDALIEEMDSLFNDVFARHPQLAVLFSSAATGRTSRRALIERTFRDRASPLLYNFINVLNEHERLELARPVLSELKSLNDERRHRQRVLVTSAIPLPIEAQQRIGQRIQEVFHKEPVLLNKVDPSILGGLIIRVGDRQIDASVRTRIDNIRNQLQARSSHEIQTGRDRFSSAT